MNNLPLLFLSGGMCAFASMAYSPCEILLVTGYILFSFALLLRRINFIDGFIWGMLVYGVQLFPVFLSLYYIAGTRTIFIGWLFLTAYFALQAGILFFLARHGRFFLAGFFGRIIAASLLVTLYVWWIDSSSLIIFDYWEGCCLFHPLVYLSRYKSLFFMLPYLGITGMTFLFFLTLNSCVALINDPSKKLSVLVAMLYSFWLVGFFMPAQDRRKPLWVDAIVCVRTHYAPCQDVCVDDAITELCKKINLLQDKSHCCCIITPESTVPCYINRSSAACDTLCAALGKAHLLLGAYRYDTRGVHNCCYWLKKSGIVSYVGKKRGMPFVERMPRLFDFNWLRSWFLSDKDQFIAESKSNSFALGSKITLQPLICSDLFLDTDCFCGKKPDIIFCALVNDGWFVGNLLAEHLLSVAWLRAVAQRAPLLYCSHTTSVFIDKYGTTWNL